ncbi:hypothetical protein GeomeDRAFT_1142 [Geobacter metallireducens RCH3]|uniref:Lipoprotein, putative n=1 Tax=Geobacter metallireducens (strain ATCC 53774 / DSM 7210 / GS-15) TaxID=269799 RepID=Q39QG3_GEOMG|nr:MULTISPECIES: hypothetical protein [Geobacter]ABB33511.1 lipoprotein, putative [Geobacter metallireducens GS-15]EHP87618.1 hypothetical protein GeomeDRAFT_1142 [Geobacter metallireducens RCH3]MBT1074179.1 hypothetical protein [Geobacter grbiciae]
MKACPLAVILVLLLLAGCAGSRPVPAPTEEYVEVDNPAATMSPSAPATIWVPKRYVDNGIPRGGELVKKGYEAATRGSGEISSPPARAEESRSYARYNRVVSVEKERVCFNTDRNAGIKPGVKLRLYRGGSVVEGIGFVPGNVVGTVTITDPVGSGACGTLDQGGEARVNDLVRVE